MCSYTKRSYLSARPWDWCSGPRSLSPEKYVWEGALCPRIKFTRMGFIGNKPLQLFPEPGRQDRVRAESEDIIGKVIKDDGVYPSTPWGPPCRESSKTYSSLILFMMAAMLSNSEQSVTASVPQGIIS